MKNSDELNYFGKFSIQAAAKAYGSSKIVSYQNDFSLRIEIERLEDFCHKLNRLLLIIKFLGPGRKFFALRISEAWKIDRIEIGFYAFIHVAHIQIPVVSAAVVSISMQQKNVAV